MKPKGNHQLAITLCWTRCQVWNSDQKPITLTLTQYITIQCQIKSVLQLQYLGNLFTKWLLMSLFTINKEKKEGSFVFCFVYHKQLETKSFTNQSYINKQKWRALFKKQTETNKKTASFTKQTETNRKNSFVYKTNRNKQLCLKKTNINKELSLPRIQNEPISTNEQKSW